MNRSLKTLALLGATIPAFAFGGCAQKEDDSSSLGVEAIVFMKRAHTTTEANGVTSVNVSGGNGQVIDYNRFVPGGSLNLLKPARADGTLTNLTAQFPQADFNGVDVSFDAKQAVFAMKQNGDDHYHIYTVQLEPGADGKYEIHQKTNGPYDDFTPTYISGGKIVFVTNQMYTPMGTRADEYEHGRAVTQLATITVEGGDADRHLFSQNLSHSVAPFLRADGKIGYSRWEHLGQVNDVKLLASNPDGTNMVAVGGQHGKPGNSLVNVREVSPNIMIGITTTRNRTIHAGTLVRIDARNQSDSVCLDANADQTGHACLDEEHVKYEILTPDVPSENGPSPAGRYREPSALPDGRLLVSWADGPVNDLSEQSITPPDFGIYMFDPRTKRNQLVYNDRGFWDLGALPVTPRKEPPVIGDLQNARDPGEPVRIGSIDVNQTSLEEDVAGGQFAAGTKLRDALHGATAVRVVEGFSSEAAKGVTMFGLTMHEGAAVLGEAPVHADGSWLAEVPPYIPIHLQPIDKFGMAIRNQLTWIQGMPGEDRRCVGCHENRTGQGVPHFGQNPTVAEQLPVAKYIQSIADREELPWDANDAAGKPFVQDTLTQKCAGCHNASTTSYYEVTQTNVATGVSTAYQIPTLDLSERKISVYYERAVREWNASYVSIFYPSTLDMGKVTLRSGAIPPLWGVPGSARHSKLVEKINLKAADGTTAWPTPLHPEDKGVTLTPEERRRIVLTMDLGGQYFARQNTGFEAYSNGDPVAPGQKY